MILVLRVLFTGRDELKSAPESCFTHFQLTVMFKPHETSHLCNTEVFFPSYIEVTALLDEALDIA